MGFGINSIYDHGGRRFSGPRSAARKTIALLAAASVLLTALFTPLLISRQAEAALFGEFTIADEAKLGREFDIMVRSRLPLVQDPEIIDYFEDMVQRLSNSMPPQPFPFQVSVIRHNAVNAFAVPGGYIFIHTGLITAMNDEAEVAGVLAHEMAHVTQRHIARRIEASQVVSLLSMVGMLAGAFLGGEAGGAAIIGTAAAGQAAMLNYSRADESEADQVGMNFFLAAGYRPSGMMDAFKILQRPQWRTGSEFPEYLSTHPAIANRITEISGRLRAGKNLRPDKNNPTEHEEFLRIQTLVRGRYTDFELAMPIFNELLTGKEGKTAQCLANLGMGIACERRNQVKNAAAAYGKAVSCRPDDSIVVREAGRFHFLMGDKNTAATLLTRAIRLNPHDYMAMFHYARLLESGGELAKAGEYYRTVLRYVPEDAEVHSNYAMVLGKNQQLFQAHLHLAYSALYENNPRKIQPLYEKAAQLAKTEADKADLEIFDQKFKERSAYWK
jgi:predicted Zn-dependent protease